MSQVKPIFWMTGGSPEGAEMGKFHAFTADDGFSLCHMWFVGGACTSVYAFENDVNTEDEKCKVCKAVLAKQNRVD